MYIFLRNFLFRLNPERAHRFALALLHFVCAIPGISGLMRRRFYRKGLQPQKLFGCVFDNQVGIAAGFDKNAQHIDVLTAVGFGFIEVGSVTARPSSGNARPRLFRLKSDRAIINRMGLNNEGVDVVRARLQKKRPNCPLFVNIAKTHDSEIMGDQAISDYCYSVEQMLDVADVLVINVSCPNSGDGRTFEDPSALESLLSAIQKTIGENSTPYLVKVSPDLSDTQLADVVRIATTFGASGFTATNTTTNRHNLTTSSTLLSSIGAGGLSGRPLHERALKTVRQLRSLTDLPIVAVGGISSLDDAQSFVDVGASLVQMYTGFIYEGPSLVRQIAGGLRIKNVPMSSN